jgi:hypothetical protein
MQGTTGTIVLMFARHFQGILGKVQILSLSASLYIMLYVLDLFITRSAFSDPTKTESTAFK